MARLRTPLPLLLAGSLAIAIVQSARADEGGVSFWLPGLFGSFAAVPAVPGWQWTWLYYHTSVSAGGNVNFASGGQIRAGLEARGDLGVFGPTYVFAQPVFGAQAAVSLLGIYGRTEGSVQATLAIPNGPTISGQRTDTVSGFGDLIPQATLKWHKGEHNYLWYLTGDIPVGNYQPGRLANVGIGHGAIDSGVGYTYLDAKKGHEFSITTGFTYNFENPDTNYRNGLDWPWIGALRNSCRSRPSSDWLATFIISSAATVVPVRDSGRSTHVLPASARSSVISFPSPRNGRALSC